MHKHVYFASVALFLVTVAFLLTDRLLWQPGVTEANVRRIRAGMTLADVEAILGAPAPLGDGAGWFTVYLWSGAEGEAVVGVGSRPGELGEVAWAKFRPSSVLIPFQLLRSRLGW
jgi:hypothetical protein